MEKPAKSQSKLTIYILIAMIAGVAVGYTVHKAATEPFVSEFSKGANLLATIFLRLVQMIIAPLVFSTLVVGIAKLGDLKAVGRVASKALLWFVSASFISLFTGLFFVNVFKPGEAIDIASVNSGSAAEVIGNSRSFSVIGFIEHVFPKSVFEAMAHNEILQLLVFSIFFGVATAALGNKGKIIIKLLKAFSEVILKMVNYVMNFAPMGVLGAIAAAIASNGLDIFVFYGKYLLYFLVGITTLWLILIGAGFLILRGLLPQFLKTIISPLIVAFTTTSSEAVFPELTRKLEKFGCHEKIVALILPLGYSFNLDGSMMYMTFAAITIAQAYGIHLDMSAQITMLFVLMVSSKGIAGVPRASLVIIAATCAMFNIPPEGIALLLPIDHFCDMFRTATNVIGNSLATVAVSKWEKSMNPDEEALP